MSPRKKQVGSEANGVKDFRHDSARRKNNPPAGLAPTYEVRERQTRRYAYEPHLDPQLVWTGKAEHTSFDVDVVPLHIHERISTRAILNAVRRPQMVQQRIMFGETPLPADKQIEFYQHEVGWANRLILGDSLLVMNSLLVKEGMAGKVQMIYIDPPYGIKYASNFQPRIDRRDVKDKDEDLTREPEQIKAYRDTWTLGIHSYLTYLRDCLLLARELLTESGSIFVQINDENLHLVRCLLDEVFGRENFVAVVAFRKTGGLGASGLSVVNDFLLWYAKSRAQVKYRQLYLSKTVTGTAEQYRYIELRDGTRMPSGAPVSAAANALPLQPTSLHTMFATTACVYELEHDGRVFRPPHNRQWSTTPDGTQRLKHADRIAVTGATPRYVRYLCDFPIAELTTVWDDTMGAEDKMYAVQTNTKVIERCILMTTDPGDLVFDPTCGSGTTAYCAEKWGRRWITCDTSRVALAIARQRLMTAKFDYYELKDPERGPAGGFIYETVPHITLESIAKNTEIDAIAAKYQPEIDQALAELNRALKGKPIKITVSEGGRAGQVVDFSASDTKTVTLPTGQVVKVNELLEWEVPREVPHPVWPEEAKKAYWRLHALKKNPFPVGAGLRACPDAGQPQGVAPTNVYTAQEETERLLETIYRLTGHRWGDLGQVPDPIPPENWPETAKDALRRFWELKRQKRKEIDESIQRNAPQETLYDKPRVKRGVVRVSGPFTVEAIPVPAVEDPTQAPIQQFEDSVGVDPRVYPGQPQGVAPTAEPGRISDRGGDYLTAMINLLKQQGGVLFPGGKKLELTNLRQLNLGYLHAEAEARQNGNVLRVAISFGPQYGSVTA